MPVSTSNSSRWVIRIGRRSCRIPSSRRCRAGPIFLYIRTGVLRQLVLANLGCLIIVGRRWLLVWCRCIGGEIRAVPSGACPAARSRGWRRGVLHRRRRRADGRGGARAKPRSGRCLRRRTYGASSSTGCAGRAVAQLVAVAGAGQRVGVVRGVAI
jgi:hypothetical protein